MSILGSFAISDLAINITSMCLRILELAILFNFSFLTGNNKNEFVHYYFKNRVKFNINHLITSTFINFSANIAALICGII